jgi:transcription elongation GreA/GreB family factor
MSRAFVKEDADAPPPPPLERPVSSAPNLVTPRGARRIDAEIARLEAAAAAAGDETAAELLRRDLRYWATRRATARIVAPGPRPQTAGFGTRVSLRRDGQVATLFIVGEDEADPDAGRIAWTAPLARAVDGAEPGETVELVAGGRTVPVELLDVGPGEA